MPKSKASAGILRTANQSESSDEEMEVEPLTIYWNNDHIYVNASLDKTIREVKELIKDKTGIQVDQQRLIFAQQQLENECSLKDYNIDRFTALTLYELFTLSVTNMTGDTFGIVTYCDESIKLLKNRIQDQEGIPAEKQHLCFGATPIGQNWWDLLSTYGINKASAEVSLVIQEVPFTLCIRFADSLRSVWLDVMSNDTIYDVKVKIQEKTNIAPELQCLRLDALILIDSVTLELYDIGNHTHQLLLDVWTI